MNKISPDIINLLNKYYLLYNNSDFIKSDPIQIPHLFSKKEDIEISAFLTSTIAWGNRKMIINNANKLLQIMDYAPFQFVTQFDKKDYKNISKFVHRTFNGNDCLGFLISLKAIYNKYKNLENIFFEGYKNNNSIKDSIIYFRDVFLQNILLTRTYKHISDVNKGSAAKRINLFLRWMIRQDNYNVDFGIWKKFNSKDLKMPLDVHSARVSRKLGLLNRKQNDWKAVCELTDNLIKIDKTDPVKYDFALFGIGVNKGDF